MPSAQGVNHQGSVQVAVFEPWTKGTESAALHNSSSLIGNKVKDHVSPDYHTSWSTSLLLIPMDFALNACKALILLPENHISVSIPPLLPKLSRTMKGLACKLACHVSWMLVENVTVMGRSKGQLMTAIAVAGVLEFSCRFSKPQFQKGRGDTCTCGGLHYNRETLSLKNLSLLVCCS